MIKRMEWSVVKVSPSGYRRRMITTNDAEVAIGFVADQTGKSPEFVAEETRNGHAVMQDDGDQTQWRIE